MSLFIEFSIDYKTGLCMQRMLCATNKRQLSFRLNIGFFALFSVGFLFLIFFRAFFQTKYWLYCRISIVLVEICTHERTAKCNAFVWIFGNKNSIKNSMLYSILSAEDESEILFIAILFWCDFKFGITFTLFDHFSIASIACIQHNIQTLGSGPQWGLTRKQHSDQSSISFRQSKSKLD